MLTLLNVANIYPYKGHADLLCALDLIKNELPDWRLWIAGRGTPLSGSDGRVHWLGERDDIPRLMQQADIFILPSHGEGLSNALLEAMAAGLPVIATRVGGNIELVGEAGFLVPMQDYRAMADAIMKLAGNEMLRYMLGEMARYRIQKLFKPEKCLDAYVELYNSVTVH